MPRPPRAHTTPTISTITTSAVSQPSQAKRVKPSRSSARLMSSIMTTNRNSTMTAPTYTSTSTTTRYSASISSQMAAEVMKHSTSASAEYTGLRAVITPSAARIRIAANRWNSTWISMRHRPQRRGCGCSSVRGVRGLVGGNHGLVAFAHREQLVLAHDVLAAPLHVVLVYARQHDRIHRAGLFAEAAVDALEQIDVVARGAARAVGRDVRVDGDAHRRAHRLAQLAGDAALLPVRVAAQRMQPAEARRLRGLLFRIVERVLRLHEGACRHHQPLDELRQQES